MFQQTVLWTAIPKARVKPLLPLPIDLGGVIGGIPIVDELLRGTLLVDVVVSPRLGLSPGDTASPVLNDYPQFRSWPETLLRGNNGADPIAFDVEFDLGDRVERVEGEIADPPDDEEMRRIAELWRAVFPAQATSVIPYEFDDFTAQPGPNSVELAAVVDFLRGVYTMVATNPRFGAGGDLPASQDLALPGVLGQLADITTDKEPPDDPDVFVEIDLDLTVGPDGVQIGVRPERGGVPPVILPIPLPGVLDPVLRRKLSWHAVRSAYGQLRSVLSPPETPAPLPTDVRSLYDFHHTVGLLGEHPQLLRRLGLAFELMVQVPDDLPPQSRLRVLPSAGWNPRPGTTVSFSPWTAYVAEGDAFFLRPRDERPEIRSGRLRLDDTSRFRVEQIDADGGGVKALQLADNLVSKSEAMPDQSGLPSLRSGGLTVIRRLADADMSQSWRGAAGFNEQVPAPGSSPAGPDPDVTLFAEHLTSGYSIDVWDDRTRVWHSLCRRTVDYRFKGSTGQDILGLVGEGFVEAAVTSGPGAQAPVVSGALFSWDGWSLSAPKPGLAAPPADENDLVGLDNTRPAGIDFGPEIRSKAVRESLPRLRFGRTYRVVARAVDVAGNAVPLTQTPPELTFESTGPITYGRFEPVPSPVVILADAGPAGQGPAPGESVERLVVRSDPTAATPVAGVVAARHIAPPKTSVSMAEASGNLDALMKGQSAGHEVLVRESGSFEEPGKSRRVGEEDQYLVRPEAQLRIPYLPDPFARAALLLGVPGLPAGSVVPGQNRIPFTGNWPDVVPFRLEVAGIKEDTAPRPPAFNGARRALRVELQESATVAVRLSSAMDPADLQVMGLTQWVAATAPESVPAFQVRALEGRNWMLMPYRELVLVHAVQRPVKPPTIPALTAVLPARERGRLDDGEGGRARSHARPGPGHTVAGHRRLPQRPEPPPGGGG